MQKIPIYEMYTLEQFRDNYPRYSKRRLYQLYINYNRVSSLHTSYGHIVGVELESGEKFTAIIRNYDMLGCFKESDPLNAEFELRAINFVPPQKCWQDESKFVTHDIRNIRKIEVVRIGDEHLTNVELDRIEAEIMNRGK